ncbi:juvenile hormone acid O-methyltransferase-like [Ptychodera flava]|uniref:juvenile hormone acid O-methyltransferase-like n=1 Tax=Ptychodera flava TaxID=63121 RepID=UPI00396A1AEA
MNDKIAKTYCPFRYDLALKNINEISRSLNLNKNDSVLDVGCGPGALTKLMAERVKSVTAFDISPVMIEEAKENSAAENITYVVADAMTSSTYVEYSNSFDKVVAYFALHWMKDLESVLTGLYQSLKPGGMCFLNTNRRSNDTFTVVLGDFIKDQKWLQYMEGYEYAYYPFDGDCDDLRRTMADVGFQDIQCTLEIRKRRLKGKEAAKGFFQAFLGQLSRIPQERQQEYVEDALAFMTEMGHRDGDEYVLTFELLTAIARKP